MTPVSSDLSEDERYLLQTLRENPSLKEPLLELIGVVGKNFEKLETGDEAEEATVTAIRKSGQAILQKWADRRVELVESQYVPEKGTRPHGKKKVRWQTSLGSINVVQKCFLQNKRRGQPSRRLRPFEMASGIEHRGWSKRCQRLIVDLGAEESFDRASKQMKEHHGVEVCASMVASTTLKHAKRAQQLLDTLPNTKRSGNITTPLVLEMDGGMVPLVETSGCGDRRKSRRTFWAELKVGVVQRLGEMDWKYTCTLGSPNDLGDRMLILLETRFGWEGESELYGVGDGATWIAEQMERLAGVQGNYLIDLYHLSEYLAEAATAWSANVKKETRGLKDRLKKGQIAGVMRKLRKYSQVYPEHEGIRKCMQYISNRPGQFKYDEAIEKGLPIGSGKVESTHRHLIQKRLKKAGAWWRRDHAELMASLRTLRANDDWERLWQGYAASESIYMAA